MGICLSVSSSDHHKNQIYNYNSESSHGHENAVIFFDHENNHDDDQITLHSLGSVYSKEGSKGINQDSAILYQGFGAKGRVMCGVFDGHGKNGHWASDMVKDRLPLLLSNQINNIKSKKIPENFEKRKEAITSAFRVMDKEIKLQQNLDFDCSGTTAVVAIRQEDDLMLANLGDSRAVLGTIVENRIKSVQLTTDLKPGVPCEAERIRSCNGRVLALKHEPHIQRVWLPNENLPGLAMSRALGDFLLKDHGVIADPELSSHRISAADQFIILATDGIWDVMSNDDVAEMVWEAAAEGNEEAAARSVVEAAGKAWKRDFPNAKVDDCTVVCLFFHKKMKANNVVSVSKSL